MRRARKRQLIPIATQRGPEKILNRLLATLLRKNLLGRCQPIEGGRKTGINGHLHDGLHNLRARDAHIEGALDMHLELGRGVAQRGERGDDRDFTAFQIQPGAGAIETDVSQ